MTTMASITAVRIARTVKRNFRRTRSAKFETEDGWFLCEVFFDEGVPTMQIRSLTKSIEEAALVVVAIQMAQAWAIEEIANGGDFPR